MNTQNTKEWFYVLNEQKYGPINKQELLEELTNESINANTLVWREGMQEWEELLKIDALLQETLNILRGLRSKESASVTSNEPPPIPKGPKNTIQLNKTTQSFTADNNSTNNTVVQNSIFSLLRFIRIIVGLIFGWQIIGLFPVLTWIINPGGITNEMLAMVAFKVVMMLIFGAMFFGIRKLINLLHFRWYSTPHPSLIKPFAL